MSLGELVVNRLNWLTDAWDTKVHAEPSLSATATAVPVRAGGRREYPANVLEQRGADGTLWLRVEVLDASPCEGGTPKAIGSGWIRAWGAGGRPAAWFHARGC
jgi:hypothetical protein